jgi:hypothetical protein
VPDLSHLWQRFMLATALVFGLALGVGATVFAYSNTARVNLGWSIFHLRGVPLWAVALVPIALILVAGTLFHWFNSLHHFTEHMRHRHRVHELEAEVTSLRKHLDELLQMPGHAETSVVAANAEEPEPAPEPMAEAVAPPELAEPVTSNGEDVKPIKSSKDLEPVAVAVDCETDLETEVETDTAPRIAPTAGS